MKNRNIIAGLECFVKKDGKYLMLQRHPESKILPGVWLAPGGKREFNEGVFSCARREIFEETGLTIKNLQVKAVGNSHLQDIDQEIHFHFLTADYAGGEVIQSPKVGKLAWLTPEQILKLDNLLAELREVFPHIISDSQNIVSIKTVYRKGNELTHFEMENPD